MTALRAFIVGNAMYMYKGNGNNIYGKKWGLQFVRRTSDCVINIVRERVH